MEPGSDAPRPVHRARAMRLMVGILLLVNLLVVGMAALVLRQDRRQAEETAATTAENLTQVLERGLLGDLRAIDMALFSVRQEMTHQRAEGGLDRAALNAYIDRIFGQFTNLSSIRATDEEGVIRYGTGVLPGTAFRVDDRAYFQEARRNPQAGLLVSEPVVGKISGQWVVILARRMDYPDGRFAGVAYATITLEQLTRSMALLHLGPNGISTLRGLDMGIYARYPKRSPEESLVGRREISARFLELYRQGATSGVYRARGGIDGVERTFSFRRLGDHPLYLHVGLASRDYLAQWRSSLRRYGIFVGLFALLTSTLAWLLHRAWRREHERTLAEVRELRGLLPICATCKKVRDDAGYWSQIETYIQERSAAQFTHGLCPECAGRLRSEFTAQLSPRT